MYKPEAFVQSDRETLFGLIREFPLATLVIPHDDDVTINHLPMLLRPDGGAGGMLVGHVARANEVSRLIDGQRRATAVFMGPDAYITPSWYPSKHQHGRVVPTWNYAVVHVHGRPRPIDDAAWLLAHLEELTAAHEAKQLSPWKVSDAPREFTQAMIAHLIGIELGIDSIEGKWKLSQNRPPADRLGVVAGLRSRGDAASLLMAGLMTSGHRHDT